MSHPDLALIVPCYNEAARLNPPAFLDFVSARSSVICLFVDDGSSDDTLQVLGRLQQSAPASRLRWYHYGRAMSDLAQIWRNRTARPRRG